MGHFFSRAIKRLTFGGGGGVNSGSSSGSSKSASRNQLPDNEQQEPHGQSSSRERESNSNRPTVQAIPVGQSIDSAEYAAFENASSALPRTDREQTSEHKTPPPVASQEVIASDVDHENDREKTPGETTADSADQNKQPEVEEAVIKIQALVRGHLTRKALKDAQQQAASVAPNALGQRQFDEESLIKNPPNAIFLPTSPLSSNSPTQEAFNNGGLQQQQQQQSNKHANTRVPPLESIAEDEADENAATTNLNQESPSVAAAAALAASSAAISEEGQRRRLSSARKQLASGNADASQSSNDATPSSPQPPSTANASIDIHCDTPASSVSIDIVDHISTRPMGFGLASVLHPLHSTTVSEQANQQQESEAAGSFVTTDGELQRVGDDEVDILPDISGIPSTRVSAVAADFENNSATVAATATTASSLPASPPHIHLAATTNSHSIDSAEAAAIRIQSAFRGYHTRKHSPYRRRRSPVAVSNSSGPQTNGFSDHTRMNGSDRVRRNLLLRQQDATTAEEEEEDDEGEMDELDGEEDEGVEGGRLMAEDLANTVLADDDEEEEEEEEDQRLVVGELESDDIERRHPSGRDSEQNVTAPRIGNIDSFEHEQPALVSSNSFEDDQPQPQPQPQPQLQLQQEQQNIERLEVVSPDEAIGSGRSSPALASDNSSDDDEEHGGGESPQLLEGGSQQQQQQQQAGGNKNKKRNRNKRKGKK